MTSRSFIGKTVGVVAAVMILSLATAAFAQVGSLYYKEVEKDGRIYVFNTPEHLKSWEASGEMGASITLIGRGPQGETVVAENETAVDLFLFKHNLEAYDRPTPKPAAPAAPVSPMTLKIGSEGELKFGALLQAWYVGDSTPSGSTSSGYYGNIIGDNTFLIRRAESRLSGKMNKDWAFEVMFDPAKKQTYTTSGIPVTDDRILQDLVISFVGLKGQEFQVGQKKIFLTEEGVRSSSELDFAERARITRTFSDKRQAGLFYKGELGKKVGLMVSVTNGTLANVPSASNDTLFSAARLDIKPVAGLLFGASGGYTAGNTPDRLGIQLYGTHVKWDGTANLPLWIRAEYLSIKNEQLNLPDLKKDGYYGSVLYTFAKKYRIGARYDVLDNDKDVADNSIETITAGFHYLPMGKNVNFKFEWAKVKEEGRQINAKLDEDYDVGIVTAQIAF